MKTKLHLRRLNEFFYKSGIKKIKNTMSHKRCLDARLQSDQPKLHILDSGRANSSKINKKFEDSQEVLTPLEVYKEFKLRVLQNKILDKNEFIRSFHERIKNLDKQTRHAPFSNVDFEISDSALEIIYTNLLNQVFEIHPENCKNNPVKIFKEIQVLIKQSISENSHDKFFSNQKIKLGAFLDIVSKDIHEAFDISFEKLTNNFLPHYNYQEVNYYSFY